MKYIAQIIGLIFQTIGWYLFGYGCGLLAITMMLACCFAAVFLLIAAVI